MKTAGQEARVLVEEAVRLVGPRVDVAGAVRDDERGAVEDADRIACHLASFLSGGDEFRLLDLRMGAVVAADEPLLVGERA